MGADFIYNTAPACELNEDRRKVLATIIDGLTADDLPDYADDGDDLAAWKRRLTDALDALDDGRRDVSLLDVRHLDYPLFLTGGTSWGDEPTEAEHDFSDIDECPQLYNQLAEWAKEDTAPAFPPTVQALVDAAEVLLADACDRGETRPTRGDEEDDYPKDADGDVWFPDWFALAEALKPFLTKEAAT